MKNSKIVFMMAICFIAISCINAQTAESNPNRKEDFSSQKNPQAKIIYKSQQKPSQLIEQVNILTNGDDVLTEKTIFEIRKLKSTTILRIVSDNEYIQLSKELQQEAIKESEVVKIINQLKK